MTQSEQILAELKQVSPGLLQIDRQNLYSVPFLYFDRLPVEIMHLIKAEADGHTNSKTGTPYVTPKGYFNDLAQIIVKKAKALEHQGEFSAELNEVAPFLASVKKQMPYTVPAGYFHQFAAAMAKPIPEKTGETKIIQFANFRKQLRYAVAAAVIGVIALAAYLFIPASRLVPLGGQSSSSLNISQAINTVKDAEIIDFLDNNSFGPEIISSNTLQLNIIDIEQSIKTTNEQDIKDYLKEFDEPAFIKAKDS